MYRAGARARHRRATSHKLGRVTQSYTCVPATFEVLATSTGLMLSREVTGALDDPAAAILEASRR
jgi:hypothetical protein